MEEKVPWTPEPSAHVNRSPPMLSMEPVLLHCPIQLLEDWVEATKTKRPRKAKTTERVFIVMMTTTEAAKIKNFYLLKLRRISLSNQKKIKANMGNFFFIGWLMIGSCSHQKWSGLPLLFAKHPTSLIVQQSRKQKAWGLRATKRKRNEKRRRRRETK